MTVITSASITLKNCSICEFKIIASLLSYDRLCRPLHIQYADFLQKRKRCFIVSVLLTVRRTAYKDYAATIILASTTSVLRILLIGTRYPEAPSPIFLHATLSDFALSWSASISAMNALNFFGSSTNASPVWSHR